MIMNIAPPKLISLICHNCGNPFIRRLSQHKYAISKNPNHQFCCSKSCFNMLIKAPVNVKCKSCSSFLLDSDIKKRTSFCGTCRYKTEKETSINVLNNNTLIECKTCKLQLLNTNFSWYSYAKGKQCIECHSSKRMNYRTNNIENFLLKLCERRAKQKNLEFTLKISDIKIPKFCPVLGIELNTMNAQHDGSAPSVDRFDNNLGYTKNNIRVISDRANRLKSNGTVEEFEAIIKYMKS